jgi:hypothetical protein
MAFSSHRVLFAVAAFSALPLLVACPKKDPPMADAAPPPPPPPPEAEAPLVITPLEDDAGLDAAADAAKKATGPYVPTNVARLRQCCSQLRVQAKTLGASPEGAMLQQVAAQCDGLAGQAGAAGAAPELAMLKAALAGRTIPAVCQGL